MNKTIKIILSSICFLIFFFISISQINKNIIIALIEFIGESALLIQLMLACYIAKKNNNRNFSIFLITASIFCLFLADTIYSAKAIGVKCQHPTGSLYKYR